MKPPDEFRRLQIEVDELRYRINRIEAEQSYAARGSPPSYPDADLTIKQMLAHVLDYLHLEPVFHNAYWQLLSNKEQSDETP